MQVLFCIACQFTNQVIVSEQLALGSIFTKLNWFGRKQRKAENEKRNDGFQNNSVRGRPFSRMLKGRPVTSVAVRLSIPIAW